MHADAPICAWKRVKTAWKTEKRLYMVNAEIQSYI